MGGQVLSSPLGAQTRDPQRQQAGPWGRPRAGCLETVGCVQATDPSASSSSVKDSRAKRGAHSHYFPPSTQHHPLPRPARSCSVYREAGRLRPVCWLPPTRSGSFPGDTRGLGNAGPYWAAARCSTRPSDSPGRILPTPSGVPLCRPSVCVCVCVPSQLCQESPPQLGGKAGQGLWPWL